MNKKVFTFALLAVFVLAQFSMASAAPGMVIGVVIPGATASIEPLPAFSAGVPASAPHPYTLTWSATGMPGDPGQYVCFYYQELTTPIAWTYYGSVDVSTLTNANGTFVGGPLGFGDQNVVEFIATAMSGGCTTPTATSGEVSTFIDGMWVDGVLGNPPSLLPSPSSSEPVSCNTFEMWILGSDKFDLDPGEGYSGIKDWNLATTGTFAPPAPEGLTEELISWPYTFPSTASGPWTFSFNPVDVAGNIGPFNVYFRNALSIIPSELDDCADFTDIAGHADEIYIRYLADLGLVSGFADGTFGPDKTLTRAEAAALFEKANGWADDTGLPASAPAGCSFTDVSASDWFAGWVWQACADGFMNGVGGGLFDPNNLLTRGQVVTIFNNIANNLPNFPTPPTFSSYLDTPNILFEVWGSYLKVRETAWTDVAIGDYYADGVINAYAYGVADGTSATTFSPNQAATRGEYVKMLYRALSRVDWAP
jgi:hypothetical protein